MQSAAHRAYHCTLTSELFCNYHILASCYFYVAFSIVLNKHMYCLTAKDKCNNVDDRDIQR